MTDEWTYTDDEPMTAKDAINELQEHIKRNANIDRQAMIGELERLRAALDDIFEMWAGSEGFIPHTAPEGYLLMLVKKMADRAALAKMEESK